MYKYKYSIIIPTYNHCDDLLKPCIESIIKNTIFDDSIELIIVANGCIDNTKEYISSLNNMFIKLLWSDNPLGFTKAINEGIKNSEAEYVIITNNDIEIMDFLPKNEWLNLLEKPFLEDSNVAITGTGKIGDFTLGYSFIPFYCTMIPKKIIDKFGLLDEIFSPGYGEDIDYCIKVQQAGHRIVQVPIDNSFEYYTTFPIYHKAEGTMHSELTEWNKIAKESKWADIIQRNTKILLDRYVNNKKESNIKYSVIIPTYNHCEDLLKPCIESIIDYTEFKDNIEIIVVANGCTDNTKEYVESLGKPFKLLWFDKGLGFTVATNEGIKISRGEYIILLNNDTVLLPQMKNEWIEMLYAPFVENKKMGITGALLGYNNDVHRNFIIFFCAMIPRKLFDEFGLLDEAFNPGAGEDTDFSIKVENAGYLLEQVPDYNSVVVDNIALTSFPMYHAAEKTVHDKSIIADWDSVIYKNRRTLVERYNPRKKYSIIIPTYNHCDDLLKPCIDSIIKYTDLSDIEIIIVANGCTDNTKEYLQTLSSPFRYLFIDEQLGYTKAVNEGLKIMNSDYVILLNNDLVLLPQNKNEWINQLEKPFNVDKNTGLTGPIKFSWNCAGIKKYAIAFWCVMIKGSLFEKIGLLDEVFSPGMGEDADFCAKAENLGYTMYQVPTEETNEFGKPILHTDFPIYHIGNGTFSDNINLKEEIISKNNKILENRYGINNRFKTSIVIPTYNHCDDLLKPCIENIIKYTDLNDKEIIIVANGCTDNTKEYVESLKDPFKIIWYDEPLGYINSVNAGILNAQGEYVITFDNDCILLQQLKNQWIDLLFEPYLDDDKVGVTGPFFGDLPGAGFIVHSGCALYKKDRLIEVGMFDNNFNPSFYSGEDLAMRLTKAGYKSIGVPVGTNPVYNKESSVIGISFPIYHASTDMTIKRNGNNRKLLKRNQELFFDKHGTKKKISIVIPTYNHCDDLLKPCIKSIQDYTTLDDNIEILIVANGCTDNTEEYVYNLGYPFRVIWREEGLGYTKATNEGIRAAKGEFIILLNNDILLLAQKKDDWINMLLEPFNDSRVGLTCPLRLHDNYSNRDVLIFFCVMIRKNVFDEIGLLDEIYTPGGGEDIDFCAKAEDAGYKQIVVPNSNVVFTTTNAGNFPIYHIGEGTFTEKDIPEYSRVIIKRNGLINLKRYNKNIKLNLGAGGIEVPGYLSVDKYDNRAHVILDITELDKEFDENTVEEIMAIHVWEHLNPYNSMDTLSMWKKVLKPGGKLVMEMPDIEKLCDRFGKADKAERYGLLNAIYGSVDTVNESKDGKPTGLITSPHLFGWYPETMYDHLMAAGFENIVIGEEIYPHPHFNFRIEAQKPISKIKNIVDEPSLTYITKERKNTYSIVIPTYNHCDDLLKPCIESIKKYTDLDKIEIIVVANGCTDSTKEYVESLGEPFKLLWYDEPIGFTKATNEGIRISKGDFIILLNNDIVLKHQIKNEWLNMLELPFDENKKVGITGALKGGILAIDRYYVMFYCAMIKREVIDKIGLLDEIFESGGCDDMDYCFKAEDAGYITVQVPNNTLQHESTFVGNPFPIHHKGLGTRKDNDTNNFNIIIERYYKSKFV